MIRKALAISLFICYCSLSVSAQCPPNIDFEQGTFNNWQCWTGFTYDAGIKNEIRWEPVNAPVPAIANRHTILSANLGDGVDPWGGFPQNCPNGSGYSIKLGNDGPYPAPRNHTAEGVSYTFTIPAGQNEYSLIYNYAVVIQEGGAAAHSPSQQARFVVEVENITDGTPLPCPMDPFVPKPGGIPGFLPSTRSSTFGGIVYYKNWAAASIDLNNLAGKTIRVFFKTAGCTVNAHFGYAYIDLSSECNSSFIGATYCPDDAFINVTAPFGYDTYTWYNDVTLTNPIGNTQTINFTPPPPSGTVIYVKMEPYPGYGCTNVLSAVLLDTLTIQPQAGPDRFSCQNDPVQIGVNPKPGLKYSWSPTTGLNNPNISNPIATPTITTEYVITVTNAGGGCLSRDTVIVYRSPRADFTVNDPLQCSDNNLFVFKSTSTVSRDSLLYRWDMGNGTIFTTKNVVYSYPAPGNYTISLSVSTASCPLAISTKQLSVTNEAPVPGIVYPDKVAVFNFPEPLQARQIGNTVIWTPATSLDDRYSYTPSFKGLNQQLYTIQLKTPIGCLTVDTQLVKTKKKILIYVPTAFTPDGNGTNDRLRPLLMGFSTVTYFRVYNWWGQLLFQMQSDMPGWDGRINGVKQDMQTVVWMIEATDVDGDVHKKQGTSILIR